GPSFVPQKYRGPQEGAGIWYSSQRERCPEVPDNFTGSAAGCGSCPGGHGSEPDQTAIASLTSDFGLGSVRYANCCACFRNTSIRHARAGPDAIRSPWCT